MEWKFGDFLCTDRKAHRSIHRRSGKFLSRGLLFSFRERHTFLRREYDDEDDRPTIANWRK